MPARWETCDDHLLAQWSDIRLACKYDSEWMSEIPTHSGATQGPVFDAGRLSPFGDANWYGHFPEQLSWPNNN
jgi:hypothetical protein